MGRMDHNGYAPAIFVQGNRQDNVCDNNGNASAANVCSDCETNQPACGYVPSNRTTGCACVGTSGGSAHSAGYTTHHQLRPCARPSSMRSAV